MEEARKKAQRFICVVRREGSEAVITDPATVRQIRSVLKLRPGERIIVCLSGKEMVVELSALNDVSVRGRIAVEREAPRAVRRATLYCAILKKDNFETAARMAVEAGVSEIVPVISKRTVKLELRAGRLEQILREAAEQCGRCEAPPIGPPTEFAAALDHAAGNSLNVFFDLGGEPWPNLKIGRHESVGLFIGPEGGWDETEIAAALARGFAVAGLGPLTLRGETAAAVAVWLAGNLPDEK